MAEITKEQLLEFIRNKDLDLDESYPRSDWWKFRDERDSYKKQRDELINDMAETKRKAEAFDEIVKVLASISKEIVEYPGDNDKQKEVIYKRWDELFGPMKILEVDHEG
ncbi:hypothetical protein ABZ299_34825 [Streptomyces sp. NPDC006184]|uniref:Uncharacterized protein n=1 Tax=Staphylococcus phage HS04 TaxID=3056398 RepID=A0AA49X4C7_9VIRU|nr:MULTISPECIES: hypothetical protein [Bacillota]WLJ25381.1 MAG: protein of unknown function (DUF1024) [Staphylococcus phage HS04]MCO6199893.1 hypothetical protein [Staphylococcus epidermidis]MDK7864287.1 hypothetical protein [Staphylococcus epidermidis]MDK8303311.1 hypothetical protein [Staphylococcus epidermidis]MDK8327271.1 hypothetical protein [Staphylococcus epidermidis]